MVDSKYMESIVECNCKIGTAVNPTCRECKGTGFRTLVVRNY